MNMPQIQHLFFDLDRTLWDFETNSRTVLELLYREYGINRFFPNFLLFYKKYQEVNEAMWQQYYKKELTKDDVRLLRFYNTIGAEKAMSAQMSEEYIESSVLQTAVFPHTHEVLEKLQKQGYKLHIISNGFREVQHTKLRNCKLTDFFETVTTSEDAGHHKPDVLAYQYTLQQAHTTAENAAMVGDDLITDIEGSLNAGLYTVFFNPKRITASHNAHKEIYDLRSLLEIFPTHF